MIRERKADLTSVKHFRHFFLDKNMGGCCFFGERRINGASSLTPPRKGRLFELRQENYTAIISHMRVKLNRGSFAVEIL